MEISFVYNNQPCIYRPGQREFRELYSHTNTTAGRTQRGLL